jgi:nucleotide-binding universal stress UspA family protein
MFGTVVLALDGSESSDKALVYATELAKEHGSKVHVVHVIELMAGRGGGTSHVNEAELKAKVTQQVAELGGAGIASELELHSAMVGGPAQVIADVAARVDADVIVTGTRGHTALVGILLGSVAQRLLHLAHCPMLIVPHVVAPHGTVSEHSAAAAAG